MLGYYNRNPISFFAIHNFIIIIIGERTPLIELIFLDNEMYSCTYDMVFPHMSLQKGFFGRLLNKKHPFAYNVDVIFGIRFCSIIF